MKEKRTEWTTQDELPVEIPLPSQFHFHSIFVCPVSKEQSTEQNPPMMLGCGHVIARESLEKISKGGRFKVRAKLSRVAFDQKHPHNRPHI
jgi:hypothetical protein